MENAKLVRLRKTRQASEQGNSADTSSNGKELNGSSSQDPLSAA